MPQAVTSTGEASSLFVQPQSKSEQLADQKEQFLTLFLTQLQNQDPTSPMDSNQMTQQLVQFTSVEQQIESNKLLDQLVSAQAANANAVAVGYIGKDVVFNGNTTTLTDTGASWGYKLNSEPDSVTINVFNEAGALVYSTPGETTVGERLEFNWDGKDANGVKLPNGSYTMRVDALDAQNKGVETQIEAIGLVTGVVTSGDQPTLLVGNVIVDLDDVTRVAAV